MNTPDPTIIPAEAEEKQAPELEADTSELGEESARTPVDEIYPNATVRVEKAQYSASHLQTLVEKRNELILDPAYQRNQVWDLRQSSELIESMLMGIPIPTIYLFEMKDGKKQVVDGRQRITSILDYLNGGFKLRNLKILSAYNGSSFSELPPKLQGVIEDYQMSFYIIQPPTPERVKYDIFDRVNRGGTRLNTQEMRNALYGGKATKLIDTLAESPEFLNATGRGISPRRQKDKYVILRAISFWLLFARKEKVTEENGEPIEYRSDIDDFLAKTMTFLNTRAGDALIEECRETFLRSMRDCYKVMGEDGFRFHPNRDGIRRPVNMPLFEIMMYIFTDSSLTQEAEITRERINVMKRAFDHNKMFMGNVDSITNVDARFRLAEEFKK